MHRLKERTLAEQVAAHTETPVRLYMEDAYHKPRIMKTREMVAKALEELGQGDPAHRFKTIVELGCGAADISGFFSWGHHVHAYECNPNALVHVAREYPWFNLHVGNLEEAEPIESDILIACEIFEHLVDPMATAQKWLSKAKYAVISSPLNGDRENDSSGGEHAWSFDAPDFANMANAGGHDVLEVVKLPCGGYTFVIMRTKRRD